MIDTNSEIHKVRDISSGDTKLETLVVRDTVFERLAARNTMLETLVERDILFDVLAMTLTGRDSVFDT